VRKKSITNSQPFVKKNEKMPGPLEGDFFDSHCTLLPDICHQFVTSYAFINNHTVQLSLAMSIVSCL